MSPVGFLQKSLQYSCPSAASQPHISCAHFMCPPSDRLFRDALGGSKPNTAVLPSRPRRMRPSTQLPAEGLLYSRAVMRNGWLVVPLLLAAGSCGSPTPDVQASVRGSNETGRYVATIANNTDTDLYVTCFVDAVMEYGSVGSDRFLVRGVAGATTDHQGSVSLDDGGAEYEIECVKEFSVEPNTPVGPVDRAAAARACSTTYRLYKAPRPYDPTVRPEQRVRMGGHIVRLAERSKDLGLVAAAERLLRDVNTDDGDVLLERFVDVDDACDGLGLDAGSRRTFQGYSGP